jgi:hypothetical protein
MTLTLQLTLTLVLHLLTIAGLIYAIIRLHEIRAWLLADTLVRHLAPPEMPVPLPPSTAALLRRPLRPHPPPRQPQPLQPDPEPAYEADQSSAVGEAVGEILRSPGGRELIRQRLADRMARRTEREG